MPASGEGKGATSNEGWDMEENGKLERGNTEWNEAGG